MKKIVVLILLGFQFNYGQEAWTSKNRILPDKLRGIATALILTHSPNPNYPELNPNKGPKYIWDHTTCIQPMLSNLEIVEVGSFIWTESQGWIQNMNLDARAFKKRFKTKQKLLLQNESYCYEKNIRYGNQLFAGDSLWYVLAKDEQGQLFKGIGIIETEGELLKN